MGRREKFLSKAVDQLRADGITASFIAGDVRCAAAGISGQRPAAYMFVHMLSWSKTPFGVTDVISLQYFEVRIAMQ